MTMTPARGPCSPLGFLMLVLASACGAAEPSPPPSVDPQATAVVAAPPAQATAAPTSVASSAPSAAPTAAPEAKPAEPPPPDPATPLGQCAILRGTINAGRAKQKEITVLTPHADRTIAEIQTETAANVGKLKLADAALAKLATAYQKALEGTVAALKPFVKAMEANTTPSAAVQKKVQQASEGERQARQAIEQHCVDLGAPPP